MLVRFLGALQIALFVASSSLAQPISVSSSLVRVYPPEEVMGYCHTEGDLLVLEFPGARRWILDNADSCFYPMSSDEVVMAIEQIDFPIGRIPVDVVILPYPRKELPRSSAEGHVIFLSPGRRPVATEHIHYTVCHEFGHIVHKAFMPDSRLDLWERYAEIRGIDFDGFEASTHRERIHEIFAEDFRVLFGSPLARNGGEVENHDLTSPLEIPGLREFLLSLTQPVDGVIIAYPNPFSSVVVLSLENAGGKSSGVEIYNVEGRLVRSIPTLDPENQVVWDGKSWSGEEVAPGIYIISWKIDGDRKQIKVIKGSP